MSIPWITIAGRATLAARAGQLCAVFAAALFGAEADASPQSYPSRPVRLIIPSTMGGPADVVSRALALKLAEVLGQQIIGENRPGANGTLGAEMVVKAPADGYTLLMASNSLAINAARKERMPFDATTDFSPVSLVARVANVLVVHPSLPVKSVGDLVAFARARPHDLMYASAGGGSTNHLAALLFGSMTGVKMVHVPYRGGRLALTEVIGGHVPLTFGNTIITLPQVRVGRLRALAVTTARRSMAAPELPTMDEAGVTGYEATGWFALMAPARTPGTVVNQLNSGVIAVMHAPEIKARIMPLGAEAIPGTPGEVGVHIRTEIAKWTKVMRSVGPGENFDER